MKFLVILAIVAVAFAAPAHKDAKAAPADTHSVHPVHMVTPVYDNSRPGSGVQVLDSGCGVCGVPACPCGSSLARPPVGTNVIIDNDLALPKWNDKPSSKKFKQFNSKASKAKRARSAALGRRLSKLRGKRFVMQVANQTTILRSDVRKTKNEIQAVARRVDKHQGRIRSLVRTAKQHVGDLRARLQRLLGHINRASNEKRIKKADAALLIKALNKISKNLNRCDKAIAFIKSQDGKFEAGLSKKIGPHRARARVLKVQLIEIAKRLDELNSITLKNAAARVDKKKKGIKGVVQIVIRLRDNIQKDLAFERQQVKAAVQKGSLNKTVAAKDRKAIKVIQDRLNRLQPAINAILAGARKNKAKRQAKKAARKAGRPRGAKKAARKAGRRPRGAKRGRVTKAKIKVRTVSLAREVDELENMTLTAARNVDKKKRGSKTIVKMIRVKLANAEKRLAKERAAARKARASKKMGPNRVNKQKAAFKLIATKLQKVHAALRIISKDNKKAKKRRVAKKAAKKARKGRKNKKGSKSKKIKKAKKVLGKIKKQLKKVAKKVANRRGKLSKKVQKLKNKVAKKNAKISKLKKKNKKARKGRKTKKNVKKAKKFAKKVLKKVGKKKARKSVKKVARAINKTVKQVIKKTQKALKKSRKGKKSRKARKGKKSRKGGKKPKVDLRHRIANRMVELGFMIDKSRNRIKNIAKLPLAKRAEKVGFEEAQILKKAKMLDRLNVWIKRVEKSHTKKVKASDIAAYKKGVAAIRASIRKLAKALALLKKKF